MTGLHFFALLTGLFGQKIYSTKKSLFHKHPFPDDKITQKTSLIGGYDLYSQLDPSGSQTVTSKGLKSKILCFDEKNTAPEVNLPASFFWSNQF